MNIMEVIEKKRGQFARVSWERKCKTLKSCPYEITKKTVAKNIRIGAQYDNLKRVKADRASGELPAENQGLRGMEWVKYPILLRSTKNGKEYLRLETSQNSKFETEYYIQGEKVSKESIKYYLQASEKNSGDLPAILNISTESITSIA